MSPLRQQMLTALHLSGKGERTQESYVREVRLLAQFYHKSPDRITEQELQHYFLHRKNVDGLDPRSIPPAAGAPKPGTFPSPKRRWYCSAPTGKPIGTPPGSFPPPGGITPTVRRRLPRCVAPVSRAPSAKPNNGPRSRKWASPSIRCG